jgi:predicted acetyltransferase/predicted GNAT family N-acyltransferase
MQIELKKLTLDDGYDKLAMLREIGPGENGFENDGYDLDENGFHDFLRQNLDMAQGIGLKPEWVPQTRFWLLDDGYPVGVGKLRHYLTDKLRSNGGHIGYCIRPSARGKVYGGMILRALLQQAQTLGIPRALLTCNESNLLSRRVIENNGGILAGLSDGHCTYWIRLAADEQVRTMHIDDYPEVYALWSRTSGVGLCDADSWQGIQHFLMRNPGLSFCYEADGQIVATILCGHDARRGYIYHVAVAEGHRGLGLGSQLMVKSLQMLSQARIHRCHLFVFRDNTAGQAFWQAMGWRRRDDLFIYTRDL